MIELTVEVFDGIPEEDIRHLIKSIYKNYDNVSDVYRVTDKRWYSEETMATVVKERDKLKELNDEMLDALKETLAIPEVKYQRSYEDWMGIIEKTTGKTWEEIEEAGE